MSPKHTLASRGPIVAEEYMIIGLCAQGRDSTAPGNPPASISI